jgi:chromosome partitioning protein
VEPDTALVETSEGMTLLPANIDLAGAEAMLLMRAGREYALKRALAKLGAGAAPAATSSTGAAPAATSSTGAAPKAHFDVVIIDCPPSLGVLTLNGLTAANDVIVPLQCETLAHRGVGQFLRTVDDVQQITNADLHMLGALPTLYDSRTTHSRDVLLDVADRYGLVVLAPPIPRTVRFAEASASGASVLAGRKNKGAIAYRELANALIKYWKSGKALPTYAPDV